MQALTLARTKDMPREEWLALRKQGIGGSDAAAILGLHPFASALSVWADKTGRAPEIADNEYMWLGRVLEEPVARRIAEENNIRIKRRHAILRHPEHPWMIADIDYEMVGQRAGIEIKTTSQFNKTDFENGEIPPYYAIQCMHYMAVTGYPFWYLFVYVTGRKPYKFVIPRVEREIESLILQEESFWNHHVLKDIMPEPDGSETSGKILKATYPQAEKEYEPMFGYDDVCEDFLSLDKKIKELEKLREEARQCLQRAVGNAERGECVDHIVRWTNCAGRTDIDKKALQADYPEIYERYLKTGEPSRRFSVMKKKEEG